MLRGAYAPLGTEPGQVIEGQGIRKGTLFRAYPDGLNVERTAWDFRSSFGYRFSPDEKLIMTQNSANPMKPCGIMNDWEPVYEVKEGKWYGWPDYYSGIPRTPPYWIIKGGEGTELVLRGEKHERLLLIPLSVRVSR